MNWLNAINWMKKNKGMTTDDISKYSGIPKGTLNKLFAGQTKDPQLSTIRAVVHALGYTLDDLYQDTNNQQFSENELTLINKYRLLTQTGQKAADESINILLKLEESIISGPQNTVPLRISEQSAAAGHGAYLGPESFQIIDVLDNDMTHRAGFAVPVSGDSMEPKYHDGDILLIVKEQVEMGEIGLFTLDGCGYVKKLGDGELISLNPEYEPIPLDDSIICNGKVVGTLPKEWIIEK